MQHLTCQAETPGLVPCHVMVLVKSVPGGSCKMVFERENTSNFATLTPVEVREVMILHLR